MPDATPGAFGPEDAAAYCGIGRATLYELIADGEGPESFRVGRRRLFRRVALDKWLAKREAEHASNGGGDASDT